MSFIVSISFWKAPEVRGIKTRRCAWERNGRYTYVTNGKTNFPPFVVDE
jgi:hypothetical protein